MQQAVTLAAVEMEEMDKMHMAHLFSTTMVVPEEQVLAVAAVLLLQLAVPEVMVVPEDMVENMVLIVSWE